MATATSDSDLDLDLVTTGKPSRLSGVGRVLTLPFRIVAGLGRFVFAVIRGLLAIIMFPIVLGIAAVKRIVGWAADLTFAIWRVVLFFVGLVVGAVRLVFRVLDATIGNAIRLVFKLVWGIVKLVLKIVTFGRFGRAAAAGAASAAGAAVASQATAPDA